ncbi:MAG: GatB/YqeY domain-containing protein [Proteobacteria bacterium]|nr:GatB/YqeY domain-containing protein [Pseudomonadota bacterium]
MTVSVTKQRINDDVKAAMRSKDKDRLGVLRLIMAAFKQKEVDERIELDDAMVLAIMDKMTKQIRDSIQQFEQAGRDDLVKKEKFELEIIQEYLPTQLNEDEIKQLIAESITESGAESVKDMGKVMSILKPRLQGRADMGQVSALVKQQLG